MKLIVKSESGLMLLRPSRRHLKLVTDRQLVPVWTEVLERGPGALYGREVEIAPGAHELERIENPFVPGGEPWLVLKGSRIGAAEAYLKRLASATRGTSNGVELMPAPLRPVAVTQPPQSTAA